MSNLIKAGLIGYYCINFSGNIVLYPGSIPPFNGIDKCVMNQHGKMKVITTGKPCRPGPTDIFTF
jgi:hypothetical protein